MSRYATCQIENESAIPIAPYKEQTEVNPQIFVVVLIRGSHINEIGGIVTYTHHTV